MRPGNGGRPQAPPLAPPPASGHPATMRREFQRMMALALPIVFSQVGLMTGGVVHSIMTGHVSAAALAGASLGNLTVMSACGIGWGVLMALDPVIAQAVGARDERALELGVQQGVALAILAAIVTTLVLVPARRVLTALGQPADVVPLAADYVRVSLAGILPFFLFIALRQSLQAQRRMGAIVVTIALANLVSALLGWVFIFGHLGAPALGAKGAAIAATITRWLMAATLLVTGWRDLAPRLTRWSRAAFGGRTLARMAAIGAPIGGQLALEIGVFGMISLIMGRIGTIALAGHQVAITIASLTYMVPLGISGAAAALVGDAVGAGDAARARRSAAIALASGAGFMLLSGITLATLPRMLATLYTDQAEVSALAARLIVIAAVFQVFDGLQVVAMGVLRGTGDTRVPMLANLFGYWVIGLPLSLWLAFGRGLGPAGMWWGMAVALMTVAAFLVTRVRRRMAGPLVRVRIEEAPA
jgi:MATE family multidrug resistance protein